MLLTIDVGNTNTVLGLYDGETLAGSWRITTDVGSDPEYPDVSARDAAALRELAALS